MVTWFEMNRGNLAAFLHVLTWLAVIVVSPFVKAEYLATNAVAKSLGFLIFILGMLVFAWAVAYLKGAFFGNVEPVSDALVTTGPYRLIRHPIYLGMVIATVGLAIGLRSLSGVIGVCLLFVPSGIYRARLEENALARRFGDEWYDYTKKTYFMFPPMY